MDQAEHLRNVVKLREQRNIENARLITVTSGKGGVGKSNTAVNLAVAFRKMGKRVIIFDADFGLANVEVMFGTVPKYNLSDVIYRGMPLSEVVTKGPMDIGFISGGSGIVGLNDLSTEQVRELVRSLSALNRMTDILIIDTGAGVSNQVLSFVIKSPEVILVVTPEPASMTDSYSLVKALYRNEDFSPRDTKIRFLANRVASEAEGKALYEKMNSIVTRFLSGSMDYLGSVPNDEALEKAVKSQNVVSLVNPSAKSARAFAACADVLSDGAAKPSAGFSLPGFFRSFIGRKQA